MALQSNPVAGQKKELHSFALPPMASLRSPKFSIVSTLSPRSKEVENLRTPFMAPKLVYQATNTVPAHLMYDSRDENLFEHYASVAQQIGVAKDYADIIEYLMDRWKVKELTGLSADGREAQEFVCGLAPRIRRLEERA